MASGGSSVLVGLRDGNRAPLGEGAPEPEAAAPTPSPGEQDAAASGKATAVVPAPDGVDDTAPVPAAAGESVCARKYPRAQGGLGRDHLVDAGYEIDTDRCGGAPVTVRET